MRAFGREWDPHLLDDALRLVLFHYKVEPTYRIGRLEIVGCPTAHSTPPGRLGRRANASAFEPGEVRYDAM